MLYYTIHKPYTLVLLPICNIVNLLHSSFVTINEVKLQGCITLVSTIETLRNYRVLYNTRSDIINEFIYGEEW